MQKFLKLLSPCSAAVVLISVIGIAAFPMESAFGSPCAVSVGVSVADTPHTCSSRNHHPPHPRASYSPNSSSESESSQRVTTAAKVECPGVPRNFYDDLNCKAIFENPQDPCPVRYSCDNFDEADAEMCYFNGETVAPGTMLNDTGNPCDIRCYCNLDEPSADFNVTKMAVFRCAIVDCPLEEESAYDENGELRKCVPKTSHDECCASETVCIDDADDDDDDDDDDGQKKSSEIGQAKSAEQIVPKKLAKCVTADNQTYVEGQEFYPEDLPCKVCICQPGYTAGESGEPWCRDVQCGTLLHYTREIRAGCSPVYYNTNRCCPIGFHCPSEKDEVITEVLVKTAPNPDKICKFGDLFLRIGDRLAPRPDAKCIECECQVPPYITCHTNPHCSN